MKPETANNGNGYGGSDWTMDNEAVTLLHEILKSVQSLEEIKINQVAMQKDIQVLQTHNSDCMKHCLPVFEDAIEKLLDARQEKADAKQEKVDDKNDKRLSVLEKLSYTGAGFVFFLYSFLGGACVWLCKSDIPLQLVKVLHTNIHLVK